MHKIFPKIHKTFLKYTKSSLKYILGDICVFQKTFCALHFAHYFGKDFLYFRNVLFVLGKVLHNSENILSIIKYRFYVFQKILCVFFQNRFHAN